MKINKIKIADKNGYIICGSHVESAIGNETLWYSMPSSFGNLLSNNSDAFLVGLLIPAMKNGEDIYINGDVSERLYYNISGGLQKLLKIVNPSLNFIKIHPENTICNRYESISGVATGFSGGIDSFCVLADHFYSEIPKQYKITHLLFNNVGSHGSGGEKLFQLRYKRLAPIAELIGLPFIKINSNLDLFYERGLPFIQTHTLRNMSIALLLQGGIRRFMYASAYDYSKVFVGRTNCIGFCDNITLPMLSTENLDAFSVGSEYTRVEKTLRVVSVSDSYKTLDVCVNAHNNREYTNCSKCSKCLRTIVTLEIAGYLEHYSFAFNLEVYRNKRKKFMAKLIGSHEPLLKEIFQFAKERNYSFPVLSHFLYHSRIITVNKYSKHILRKLKKVWQNK